MGGGCCLARRWECRHLEYPGEQGKPTPFLFFSAKEQRGYLDPAVQSSDVRVHGAGPKKGHSVLYSSLPALTSSYQPSRGKQRNQAHFAEEDQSSSRSLMQSQKESTDFLNFSLFEHLGEGGTKHLLQGK